MVSTKKLVISLCIIGLIVLGAIALVNIFDNNNQNSNAVKTSSKDTINLGFVTPLSGPGASVGQEELDVAQMAVDDINSKGGVLGKKLELIPEDGKCEGKEASNAANKLVNIDKVILFGSRARGDYNIGSDFDILIISKDFEGKKYFERPRGLYLQWGNNYKKYEIDLICLTPEEFRKKKKEIGIIREVANEGIEIK